MNPKLILGSNNPELPHPIVYRGAVFADATDFDKCVALWLHALDIKQNKLPNTPVAKDVLRFAQVFSEMFLLGVKIKFDDFLIVLRATASEMAGNVNRLDNVDKGEDAFDDPDTIIEELESNMLTFLYLMVIFGKIGGDESDLFSAMKIIHYVVAEVKPKSWKTGRTLIHLAVDSETTINDFHIRDVVRFPCSKTAKLLIEVCVMYVFCFLTNLHKRVFKI